MNTQETALIMVVEDEPALSALLRYNLESRGFRVAESADGADALRQITQNLPDLVLLDWMLPSLSGIDVCRHIRRKPETRALPVIMLTARGEDADSVHALDIGADDYIVKPFNMDMLMARVRAVLRRTRPVADKGTLEFADLSMDLATHRVQRGERVLQLGPTEYRLLQFFMRHPRRVFSREDVLGGVWGAEIHVEPRTVDAHIRRLRRVLNEDDSPDLIRTVRAVGYALDDSPEIP